MFNLVKWRVDNIQGLDFSQSPSIVRLLVDFAADDYHAASMYPGFNRPCERLYGQLFRSFEFETMLSSFVLPDEVFPLRLRFSMVTCMEVVVGRSMRLHERSMWRGLSSLTELSLILRECVIISVYTYVCLLPMQARVHTILTRILCSPFNLCCLSVGCLYPLNLMRQCGHYIARLLGRHNVDLHLTPL